MTVHTVFCADVVSAFFSSCFFFHVLLVLALLVLNIVSFWTRKL